MSIEYDTMENQREAMGQALEDEERCSRELADLRRTSAQSIVNRLTELLAVVQEESGDDQSPETVMESLVCPLKHDVADLLKKRTQLKADLQHAQDFLQKKVPYLRASDDPNRPRPVQD